MLVVAKIRTCPHRCPKGDVHLVSDELVAPVEGVGIVDDAVADLTGDASGIRITPSP